MEVPLHLHHHLLLLQLRILLEQSDLLEDSVEVVEVDSNPEDSVEVVEVDSNPEDSVVEEEGHLRDPLHPHPQEERDTIRTVDDSQH